MKTVRVTVLLCLLAATSPAYAVDRVLLAAGVTDENTAAINLGLGQDWGRHWFESETGYLSGYWHAGYTWWEAGEFRSNAHTISLSPVLVYQFHGSRWRPFLEAGIGAAVFTRSQVGDRDLGSTLHFEDRFGAGIHLGSRDVLMFRVIHYSNAGLSSRNQGINAWSLVWGRSL